MHWVKKVEMSGMNILYERRLKKVPSPSSAAISLWRAFKLS
jgi:hypothetical protein